MINIHQLHHKAFNLGWPNARLKATVQFNPENSNLAKKLNKTSTSIYDIVDIVDRGILIGKIGHLQLIEWPYIMDIY
jgi:hypothetical protein